MVSFVAGITMGLVEPLGEFVFFGDDQPAARE